MTDKAANSISILRMISRALRESGGPLVGELELADVFDALADQWGQGEVTPLVMAVSKYAAALAKASDEALQPAAVVLPGQHGTEELR